MSFGGRGLIMQLGKTLIGAIIGAVLGVGLLIAAFLLLHLDAVWLSIPVAIITGLAVRIMVATKGHASYARGAITAIIALAAFIGGWPLAAKVATLRAESTKPVASANGANAENGAPDGGKPAEPAADAKAAQPMSPKSSGQAIMQKMSQPGQNPLDYVWLGIAALVAYELGRGSGAAAPRSPIAGEPAPAGTHPDA
jgi:hypothetical protein